MKIEISDSKKWQNSLTLKIVLLAVMGIFLLIPVEMIKSVIRERQMTSENVKKEIALQWSGRQNVTGPVLNIPVRIFPVKKDSEPYKTLFHLMPEDLIITGNVKTEIRHRSIYKTVVYNSELKLSGKFNIPGISTYDKSEILWEEAYYSLGISDNRGVKGRVALQSGENLIDALPGLRDNEVFLSGISFPAVLNGQEKEIPFSVTLNLSGSENLSFSPVGKTTSVSLKSEWNAPGFNGSFLPSSRVIDEKGFSAQWLVTHLNRNFPQIWSGNEYKPVNDSFGVDFVMVADHYQKSQRSAKYGILFIALTFLALLFTEIATRENLHILNYLLVSLALVLFFSLLNSLSEHIGFNPAYLISASATIILISAFLQKLVRNFRPVLIISGILVFLYGFIFILLTLNDYSYLAGNIGLFIILAITMIISTRLKIFDNSSLPGQAD
jgi:inner membrane protein